MAKKDNPIKMFTAVDIERYQQGLLSARERHELEKAALDDPFLADALEGYAEEGVNVSADLADLQQRLSDKTTRRKVIPVFATGKNSYSWLRIAAMIIVVAGTGLLVYQFGLNKKAKNIAQAPSLQTEDTKSDSNSGYILPAPGGDTKSPDSSNSVFANPKKDNVTTNSTISNLGGSANQRIAADSAPVVSSATDEVLAKRVEGISTNVFKAENNSLPDTSFSDFSRKKDFASNKQAPNQPAANQDKVVYAQANTRAAKMDSANKQKWSLNEQLEVKSYGKSNTFRGRVTDINNNPVPFANVTNTQDNVGTYTDARGNFNLTSPDSTLNVQVRSLGYNSNNIQLHNNVSSNQIVMKEDRNLAEVVISNKKPNATSRARDGNMKLEGEPEPEDGWDNYDSYLANNLNPPEDFKIRQTGNDFVKVSFEVNSQGEPVEIRVEKSLCDRCDQEAIRLIKEGPKWRRKAKKGRTTVTISF